MDFSRVSTLRITCFRATAPWLRQEVTALGYPVRYESESGVEVEGSLRDAMRLNLHLRTGLNVLYRICQGRCRHADELYALGKGLPWEEYIAPDGYLTIDDRVHTQAVRNTMFATQRLKDAIVDRLRERTGARPDAGPERRGVVVLLYWKDQEVQVYLNTSGMKISDRGYRRCPHRAPLREVLAASLLGATEYAGDRPLVLPMCGSGTLAVEAVLLAQGRAPGLLRERFGFQHIPGFDEGAWQALRSTARRQRRRGGLPPVVASDIDPEAVDCARRNAATAGVADHIEFQVCDFAETRVPPGPGTVLLNPEYGERLGELEALKATYARIGDFFKQRCAGYTGWIFTGNRELAKCVGLRASRRIPFFNAKIECRLLRYELYRGSR